VIQESRNQFQCTIIALSRDVKALDKALDKALINQVTEHSTKHDTTHSTKHSKYNNTIDNRQYTIDNTQNDSAQLSFTQFWEAYAKKVDSKKCQDKWMKLTEKEQQKALQVVGDYVKSTPDVQFRKNPLTWINGKCWNDQIQQPQLPLQTERPKYIMQPRDFATDAEYEDYCRKNGLTPKY
jgi:hypothetical protein